MGRKQKKGRPGPIPGGWMTTYADMVTLLMCFFVLMYAMLDVDEERFAEIAAQLAGRNIFFQGALGQIFTDGAGVMPDEAPPVIPRQDPDAPEVDEVVDAVAARLQAMEGMAETFRTYMAPHVMADRIEISVSRLGEYITLTFESGMMFDSGQDILRPEAIDVIDYVAVHLRNFPGHRIAIEGHTDDVPINNLRFPSNFHLSAARAIAVMTRLMDYHDFDPIWLTAVGLGEYRPVDTNYTPEGRANNRRVEIKIYAQQVDLSL